MVNQALRIKIAYRSKKEEVKEKEKKENTRDRSVPDGSDKNGSWSQLFFVQLHSHKLFETLPEEIPTTGIILKVRSSDHTEGL